MDGPCDRRLGQNSGPILALHIATHLAGPACRRARDMEYTDMLSGDLS
jgi:hypothetical protein